MYLCTTYCSTFHQSSAYSLVLGSVTTLCFPLCYLRELIKYENALSLRPGNRLCDPKHSRVLRELFSYQRVVLRQVKCLGEKVYSIRITRILLASFFYFSFFFELSLVFLQVFYQIVLPCYLIMSLAITS